MAERIYIYSISSERVFTVSSVNERSVRRLAVEEPDMIFFFAKESDMTDGGL